MSEQGAVDEKPLMLGWREWVALPGLGIDRIKAKLDTGARSATLHAAWLETYEQAGQLRLRFGVRPRRRRERVIACDAPVHDRRAVTDSGGHREKRYVIRAAVRLAGEAREIEITLTNRDTMLFPMLLGRTALRGWATVDPAASYTLGRPWRKTRKPRR